MKCLAVYVLTDSCFEPIVGKKRFIGRRSHLPFSIRVPRLSIRYRSVDGNRYILVIGGSAGSIEAITEVVRGLPCRRTMPSMASHLTIDEGLTGDTPPRASAAKAPSTGACRSGCPSRRATRPALSIPPYTAGNFLRQLVRGEPLVLLYPRLGSAQDWTRFRGPNRICVTVSALSRPLFLVVV